MAFDTTMEQQSDLMPSMVIISPDSLETGYGPYDVDMDHRQQPCGPEDSTLSTAGDSLGTESDSLGSMVVVEDAKKVPPCDTYGKRLDNPCNGLGVALQGGLQESIIVIDDKSLESHSWSLDSVLNASDAKTAKRIARAWVKVSYPHTIMLLVGNFGKGKSSTGNSILGTDCFETSCYAGTQTTGCQLEKNEVGERVINVIDAPGCPDNMEELMSGDHGMDALIEHVRELDAILLVLRFGSRMTREEIGVIQVIRQIFGANVFRDYGVVVFTGGDVFERQVKGKKTFTDWCMEQRGPLKDILEESQNRFVLFNNATEVAEILKRQREKLMSIVDDMRKRGERYQTKTLSWNLKAEKDRMIQEEVYVKLGRISVQISNEAYGRETFQEGFLANMREEIREINSLISQLDDQRKEKLDYQVKYCETLLDEHDGTKSHTTTL